MTFRVETFVTAIGLPGNLLDLDFMVGKNIEHGERHPTLTDLDLIVGGLQQSVSWSVPPWARPNDIAIFYCTQRAATSAWVLRRLIETVAIEANDGDNSDVEELREVFG